MDEGRGGGYASKVVPADRVRLCLDHVRVGPSQPIVDTAEPQIELVHEGNTVRLIQVTCTCGEKINIRCDYDSDK